MSDDKPDKQPTPLGLDGDAVSSDMRKFQPLHAFVIYDEEGICRLITLTLAALGIKSEFFHTAPQAVAALEHRQPALIFLDIALKGSDAIDVIRTLGEKSYTGTVQLMSGSNQTLLEDVRRVGIRHGLNMRPPIEKPFRLEVIRQAVTSTQLGAKPDRGGARQAPARLGLEEALAKGWLELWYQPKIDLRTQSVIGAEGLVRCRHPVHGVLTPASFLSQSSDEGMRGLTEYVISKALRDWNELTLPDLKLHVAVNTSVGALANMQLPSLIRDHRPQNANWPGLILEITESEVIRDVPLVHEIATQLRLYGITFAIDDFGEGFSSFARLRELPFAELKLDMSFVKDCSEDAKNAGICQAIIDLAHHFGADAVAEGIENKRDLDTIRCMGCDIGQGYLIARPMPKGEFAAMLREDRRQSAAK
jgi:EAL domain-containing protein (putative c-di-GMP-specific phosphodiesterase class I)/ActR/RegA family two-component response regulator